LHLLFSDKVLIFGEIVRVLYRNYGSISQMKSIHVLLSLSVILHIAFVQTAFPLVHAPQTDTAAVSPDDTVRAAQYLEKGITFLNHAQYDSSSHYLEKSRDIYAHLIKIHDRENIWSGFIKSLNWIGLNLWKHGKFNAATDQLLYALGTAVNKFGEKNNEVAQSYHNLGIMYYEKADHDNAIGAFEKSLSIKLELSGAENIDAAATYHNIGVLHYRKGDYYTALEYNEKSLSIRRRILGDDHPFIAASYNNIGNIYLQLGDYDRALDYHLNSLTIRLSAYNEIHPVVIQSYNNVGKSFENKEDFENALEQYEKALSLSVQLSDPGLTANSHRNIGDIYRKQNRYDQALDYYLNALAIWQNGHAGIQLTELHLLIGQIYLHKRDFYAALRFCQDAIKSVVTGFDDESIYTNPPLNTVISEVPLLSALRLKAKIFKELAERTGQIADLETALSTYTTAVEVINILRTGYKAVDSKYFLSEQITEVYEEAIHTSLMLFSLTHNDTFKEQAFIFAENCKAAVLLEAQREVHAKRYSNLPADLLEEENHLRTDVTFFEAQLHTEYQKKDSRDSAKISEYQNILFGLKKRYDDLISYFEHYYPDYYRLKYWNKNVSVEAIREHLQHNSALIDYFIGDKAIFIFAVSKDAFDAIAIEKPVQFPDLVKDYYSSILKTERDKYLASANELSYLLIAPVLVSPAVQKRDKLVIIPHDVLYKIPFEALFTSHQPHTQRDYTKIDYVIKKFDIAYHYSAQLYINGFEQKTVQTALRGNSTDTENAKTFIGFAPVFPGDEKTDYSVVNRDIERIYSYQDDVLRSSMLRDQRFKELSYSRQEIETIVTLFSTKQNVNTAVHSAYLYSDATKDAFKSEIKDYSIIHIASHSFINEVYPQLSGIVFAPPVRDRDGLITADHNHENILFAGEVYNLELNADLVVLSSCESGLGKLIKGEGMLALNRAFLYSGAANIIFSLWKVPDMQTSEFMIEFYDLMLSEKNYAESLRQTKLSFIKNEFTARPHSWAGFLLIGAD
jgi:CHAT domain-containing protein/Tfp pilus assembly protein PilF